MADQTQSTPNGTGTGDTLEAAMIAAAKNHGGHGMLTVSSLGVNLSGTTGQPIYQATVEADSADQNQSTPNAAAEPKTAASGERKIYRVLNGGCLTILKTNPLTLQIDALGETRTGGWSQFRLSPYIYVHPPLDGIYDFDFLGTPPSGIATQALTPCQVQERWPDYPADLLKGVRIHAEGEDGKGQSVVIML